MVESKVTRSITLCKTTTVVAQAARTQSPHLPQISSDHMIHSDTSAQTSGMTTNVTTLIID